MELLAKLRADTRFAQQRVMLCTALNDRQTIDRAAALGVSHYIVKPFAKEHVLRQVRHACAETAAAVYFESITDVAARLGVATTGVREFLHGLHTDAEALQATLSLGRSPESMRVNALKSAAVNLGARSLAARLGQLEGVLLTTGDWSRVAPALAVEIERLRAQLRIAKPDGSAAVDASADGAAAPLGSPASTPAVETAAAMATDAIKPAAAPAPAS